MKQQTISDLEYSARKRKTRREEFLEIMEEIIPWDEWVAFIAPYYPSGKRGRPPKGIEKILPSIKLFKESAMLSSIQHSTLNSSYHFANIAKWFGHPPRS